MFALQALVACATGGALPSFAALQTNVVERHYDRFGRPVGISLNGERRTEIAYDEATGRIASMRVAGADEPFRWEYEPGTDLKKTLRYPNGATVDWEYESNRDLVTLVANDVYSSYRYEYDAAGRRVAKNDERYEYNVRGELVGATNVSTGAEFAYCYDDIGNRQWSREFGTNCVYVANELNQYTNIVRGGVHEFSAFDLDGNQTNVVTATGEWAVEYNGENRPVLWRRKSDGVTIRMAYDRMGRRVMKNDKTFVYDGYLNISQTIWDPTEPIATRPLVWRGAEGNSLYFHDGSKNVVHFVPGSSMSTTRHFDYAPFGGVLDAEASDDNCWRFSSEFADLDMSVTYYIYRCYNQVVGRWLSSDPVNEIAFQARLVPVADDSDEYLYLRNEPISGNDFLGLKQVDQVKCGSCNICLDNDSSSGDGNSYKIHWLCSTNGKTPSTCRGGGSAQYPGYGTSHGTSVVPPRVRKCIEERTRWRRKTLKLSVPVANSPCCKSEEYESWELSPAGMSTQDAQMTTMTILTCAGIAIVLIALTPVGL